MNWFKYICPLGQKVLAWFYHFIYLVFKGMVKYSKLKIGIGGVPASQWSSEEGTGFVQTQRDITGIFL